MQFLSANEVRNFVDSLGLDKRGHAPARQLRRRRVTLSGVPFRNTQNWQRGNQWDDGDGWGNESYGRGDRDTGVNLGHEYGSPIVFNPQTITGSGASISQSAYSPDPTPLPGSNTDQINYLSLNPTNFSGSAYLAPNYKRGLLLFQNQDAALTLKVNFGVAASATQGLILTPGLGFLYDTKVPNNAIYLQFIGGNGSGYMIEGTNMPTTPLG